MPNIIHKERSDNMIIVLIGRMSVGKDTVLNAIHNKTNIPILISHTTRPMRAGETNHKEYHFITKDEFKVMYDSDKFIEYRMYKPANNDLWYYGLSKEEAKDVDLSLVIMDPTGYESLATYFGNENVVGILLEADKETIYNRAILRHGDTIEEINRRIEDDDRRFSKFKKNHPECYLIYNNNDRTIDSVADEIIDIIKKVYK